MTLSFIDKQNDFLIDSNKIEEFVEYSTQIYQMKEDLQEWFAREEKLKDYRFSYPQSVLYTFQTEIQRMKENNENKTKEEEENLSKLEKKIKQIELSTSKSETNIEEDSFIKAKMEQEKLEVLYHEQAKDRMKEIILFEKEAALYLTAIHNKKNYYILIEKLKEIIEEGYDNYENVEYEELKDQIENHQKYYICPQCCDGFYSFPENDYYYYNTYIECPLCHFEFCPRCYCSRQDHHFDEYFGDEIVCPPPYFYYIPQEKKQVSFFIWPMNFEKSKIISRWLKLSEQYFIQKEKYDKIYIDFMIKKDETQVKKEKETTRLISLSKLCARTRIARVILRDIQDREEIKKETLKIIETVLLAQSIITSSYPTLFYIFGDTIKYHSLTEKIQSLINETAPFIELLYHPEHSSMKELQQTSQTIQKIINDIQLISHDDQI
ncbi:hypothetical protein M9Y10_039917 [Tritrichomonas musculus]|uniref:RING-type domain-containing protein n=1 Tax=Tritrichomonas musculus TaxID=1915356 RepID=A0ABR2GSC1_9EUKA